MKDEWNFPLRLIESARRANIMRASKSLALSVAVVGAAALSVSVAQAHISNPVTLPPVIDFPRPPPVPAAVPEPATWAMMLAGIGLMGAVLRSARGRVSARLV